MIESESSMFVPTRRGPVPPLDEVAVGLRRWSPTATGTSVRGSVAALGHDKWDDSTELRCR